MSDKITFTRDIAISRKELVINKDSIELLVKLAETLMLMEDNKVDERQQNALKYINLWLEYDPDNIDAMTLLGKIKEKQGKYDESLVAFEKAVNKDSKRHQTFYYLGQLFEKRKEFKKAITAYKQWLFL